MIRLTARLAVSLVLGLLTSGCAHVARSASAPAFGFEAGAERSVGPSARAILDCASCETIPMPDEISEAVEARISELEAMGGDCARYGTVLERSYRQGQIIIRPFMWRVGSHLASGEARSNGDMVLAREIDALNVGVRTVGDVLWSVEHEATHIAFGLASGFEATEERANSIVRGCRT